MKKKLGIIDLGSNSVRMNIMKIYENGSYKMADHSKEMVRLSQGMGREMTLKEEPIKRTIHTLKLFNKLLRYYEIDDVYCIATAAVRSAKNRKYFLDKVKEETGLEFDVITGKKEAYYDYLGVINTIQIDNCIIMDVGGASTEIALVNNREIKEAVSFDFGAVTLSENYLENDKISSNSLKKLEEYILNKYKDIDWLKEGKKLPIIGLGGSIRTIAKVDKKSIKLPFDTLHNYRVERKEFLKIYNRIKSKDLKGRKKISGVSKKRADIIVGGIAPLDVIMKYLNTDSLIISGNGLREGVFYSDYLKEIGYEKPVVNNILDKRIENILKNYDVNINHSKLVKNIALQIFDQTKKLHKMGHWERKILYSAAMLHDIGMYVDYYNHHKHGFYLALNSRIYGLKNKEIIMVAFIIGKHRESSLKKNWKEYSMLIDKKDYKKIKILSLFLKIAEKLDRSEYGNVEKTDINMVDKTVNMRIISSKDPELEIAGVLKFKKEFKKLLGKDLNIS